MLRAALVTPLAEGGRDFSGPSVPTSLPDYANPPVIEVVGGVGFAPIEGFKAVHLGLLWERFRDQFPRVEEHPPIAMPLEVLQIPNPQGPELQFLDTPPLPRIWFLDESGNGIVQVQRDARCTGTFWGLAGEPKSFHFGITRCLRW